MNKINSKEYWDERFLTKDWEKNNGKGQSLFFAKIAHSAMPAFFKRDLVRNAWTVIDIGCALGDGTAYLAKQFPSCRFIGYDFSFEAIKQASDQYTNCEFAVADIYELNTSADVIFSSNTLEHLNNPNMLIEQMCNAAKKYVVLLLPLDDSLDISEHINIFSLDSFPLHIGNFYLESYSVIDCSDKEGTYWPGEQILLIYTCEKYRPEQMTLRDINDNFCSLNENRVAKMSENVAQYKRQIAEMSSTVAQCEKQLADAKVKIKQQEDYITEVVHMCNDRDKLFISQKNEAEKNARLSEEVLYHQKELTRLKKNLENQNVLLCNYKKLIDDNQNVICDVHGLVNCVRNFRSYKLSLFFRRCLSQLIKGNYAERKDFLLWTFAKIRSKFAGKPLHQFDLLNYANYQLIQQSSINYQALLEQQLDETSGFVSKAGHQIFIFASIPYYDVGGGQRSAQLANAFNLMGYEVYYIFGFDSTESKRENMFIPAKKHLRIDQYPLDSMISDIRDNAVLIFEIPYSKFMPYLDYANMHGYTTIYEHIDNWDSTLGCLFYNKIDFEKFVQDVQYITVTARILGEKIKEAGRTDYLYSANAVDSSLFEPTRAYEKPNDLVTGKKTLLYFGSLWGEWFDWDLLVYVAEHCECAINLIGDYQPIADRIKNFPSNFYFLGIKKHEDLPAYLQYSDIAILPFKNCTIGKYVSPLKIFEYISMNKPVLATPLDDIMDYPNVVLSDQKEVWVDAVNEGIEVSDATVFTAENSWLARCNTILDYIGRNDEIYPSVSIIVLNRNNMRVIFRCVSSLLAFTSSYQCEIIVVDNDSTDGSYEKLQEEFGQQIKLIRNSKNGCSSGRNLGVKNATGEMLLFLDSDQWIIGEHFMDAPLDLMCKDSSIGAVAWNAGWFDPGHYRGPIVDYLPNRGIASSWILCRTDIAYLATSGMLVRKSLFNEIGGFDEFYDPTCFEDTDLSLKIRHAGYELAYCPYMAIMHLPHQTTNSGDEFHQKLMSRNGTYFMDKWKRLDPKLLEYHLK